MKKNRACQAGSRRYYRIGMTVTATLSELSRLQPDSMFERARFRPNLLVETDQKGFVEDDWVSERI